MKNDTDTMIRFMVLAEKYGLIQDDQGRFDVNCPYIENLHKEFDSDKHPLGWLQTILVRATWEARSHPFIQLQWALAAVNAIDNQNIDYYRTSCLELDVCGKFILLNILNRNACKAFRLDALNIAKDIILQHKGDEEIFEKYILKLPLVVNFLQDTKMLENNSGNSTQYNSTEDINCIGDNFDCDRNSFDD